MREIKRFLINEALSPSKAIRVKTMEWEVCGTVLGLGKRRYELAQFSCSGSRLEPVASRI
jgi:hypothetical protein